MAEKCTKTSSPVERWINPYPFAPLNHFTVPFSLTEKLLSTDREELGSPNVLYRCPGEPGRPLRKTSGTRLRLSASKKLLQSKRLLGAPPHEENAARTFGALDLRR